VAPGSAARRARNPKKPLDPLRVAWTIKPIARDKDKFGKGVPVVDWKPGQIPTEWITTGALPMQGRQDVLDRLGGYADARPSGAARSSWRRTT
jgi:hypothetical protein